MQPAALLASLLCLAITAFSYDFSPIHPDDAGLILLLAGEKAASEGLDSVVAEM